MGKERKNTPAGDDAAADAAIPARQGGFVRVRGAREHNLKEVDVDVPRCCCRATAGGRPSMASTSGTPAWSIRRRA